MIVSEKNVSDALTYLAEGGAAPAEASYLAAEQRRERLYAELFLLATGGVEQRKCAVLIDKEYQEALAEEIAAKVELSRCKSRASGADKICDIYRTENANARAAEKIR